MCTSATAEVTPVADQAKYTKTARSPERKGFFGA